MTAKKAFLGGFINKKNSFFDMTEEKNSNLDTWLVLPDNSLNASF